MSAPAWDDPRFNRQAETLLQELRRAGITDEGVLQAIRHMPRHRFLPPQLEARAWENHALPIDCGQTISQPYIVALMTQALELQGSETVLEIGTGSGYQAAILARLCERVITVEYHAPLSQQARDRLNELGVTNVECVVGDGSRGGFADQNVSRMLIAAAAPDIPRPLYQELTPGGIMVLPVGTREEQQLFQVTKGVTPQLRKLCDCRFVDLVGDYGWQEAD